MKNNTQIISAKWVVPIVPRNIVLEDHSVVIEGGSIIEILPIDQAKKKYSNVNFTNLENHALIPGLINAHTHAAMNLFRGLANDVPLMTWLNEHIWPAEAKFVNQEFMRDGTELAIAEMLLSGTTCFNDMYFYPDVVAQTAQSMGIRAFVGIIVLDFP
ncbi:MAG: amidohydrolase family protein, partial [Gammaproteobacteria bacterium]|nr:amidohydrolase family protein [Gammaproteobacteria bacterium]